MITIEAVERTVNQLRCNATYESTNIADALDSLIANQEELDAEEEIQHREIINEIGLV